MPRLDDMDPIEVADGIWWVGFADSEAGFSNNPYLLVDDGEAALLDPGPAHPIFRDLVLSKVSKIIDPGLIRYVIVHHQDPDLCGLIPFIEHLLHPELVIAAHPRTALFIPYYGVRTPILPVGDDDQIEFPSGRRLKFVHLPYLHFSGNTVSLDESTGSLFSSDLFAAFDRKWSLYAGDGYLEMCRYFIEHYVGSTEALSFAYERLKELDIRRILPQHGAIIERDIPRYLKLLTEVESSLALEELTRKPSPGEAARIADNVRAWLADWLDSDLETESLEEMLHLAHETSVSSVSLLLDRIAREARSMGVANPVQHGKIHRSSSIEVSRSARTVESLRRRMLTRQFGIPLDAVSDETAEIMGEGFVSVRTPLAVMFVDIRGFTRWSDGRDPGETVEHLNRQLALEARVIRSRGGRINKLMGDGILAYFPASRVDDCIDTAVEIQRQVTAEGMLPVGVGCAFGEVILGDIGEEARLDFTLIGAPVNRAARMCDSAGPGQVCLSAAVCERTGPVALERLMDAYPASEIEVRVKEQDPPMSAVRLTVG